MTDISVIGCGLGYSLSCLLANYDHRVVGVDINPKAFENPRIDKGMAKFKKNNPCHDILFTTDYNQIIDSEVIFIFVATPLENGRLSTSYVESAIASCLEVNAKAHYILLSTMPIGGCDKVFAKFPSLKQKLNYVPPMVRQGRFYETFTHPPSSWQMISDNASTDLVFSLYKPILSPNVEYIVTDYRTIEAAKLITNIMLTNRIVFANAVDDWTKTTGLDAFKIMEIVGKDKRIGCQYLKPDGAVGGACLPRDLEEVINATNTTSLHHILWALKDLNEAKKVSENQT